MTITHKTVLEEAKALRAIFDGGNIEIPKFLDCAWPGLLLTLWLLILPIVAFGLFGSANESILIAIGFGGFLGFFMFMVIFNMRSLWLAIPFSFRCKSKVFYAVNKKVKCYLLVFLLINLLVACVVENSKFGSIVYTFVTFGAMLLLSFIFSADIGRYRLSAFTSVLELIKSRKKGGDE